MKSTKLFAALNPVLESTDRFWTLRFEGLYIDLIGLIDPELHFVS